MADAVESESGARPGGRVKPVLLAAAMAFVALNIWTGSPLLAQENVLANPAVDPDTFKPRADYLLEVRGMSMRDAGILEGDWLAVHKR